MTTPAMIRNIGVAVPRTSRPGPNVHHVLICRHAGVRPVAESLKSGNRHTDEIDEVVTCKGHRQRERTDQGHRTEGVVVFSRAEAEKQRCRTRKRDSIDRRRVLNHELHHRRSLQR